MVDRWQFKTLGEVAANVSRSFSFEGRSDVVFINTGDVSLGRFTQTSYSPVKGLPGQAKKAIRLDDILLSEIRPSNGRYAYVNFDAPDHVVSTKFMVIRPTQNVSPQFLYKILTAPQTLAEFQSIAESRSGTFPQITFDSIAHFQVPIPSADEQEQFVAFLDALDDKIEVNRQMNQTLEAMTRAIFKSWFIDFDPVHAKVNGNTPSGLDPATAALFPDSFQESSLGPIPNGWHVGSLDEVADNPRRSTAANNISPDTAYIALEHMPRRSIALNEWGDANSVASGKFSFHKGEILFGKLRPYFHKVGVAPLDGVCSTDILVIVPKTPSWFGFALMHLSSDELIAHTNAASTGTKMPRTNWQDISRFDVAVPDERIAAVFTNHMNIIMDRIQTNIFESQSLSETRDALLPKLLSGELELSLNKPQ